MKIALSGKRGWFGVLIRIKKLLEKLGHTVTLPEFKENASFVNDSDYVDHLTWFKRINDCDALLVVNLPIGDNDYYIGRGMMLDLIQASILNKKLFVYTHTNDLYEKDLRLSATCIFQDLEKISM